MIWLYRFFYLPVFLITFPYYLWRMLKRGGYAQDFHHRLGLIPPLPPKKPNTTRIWIHAVSVGEINAINPLIQKLLAKQNVEIILTTNTSTAYTVAKNLYAKIVQRVDLFPLDFYFCTKIAWKRINPDLLIFMESELWPEKIYQAALHHVPVLLINARLSDRSFKRYSRIKYITQSLILNRLSLILAGTQLDFDRFIKIGANPQKIHCTGNIKFDVTPKKILTEEEKSDLIHEMGFISNNNDRPLILMGSSTWPGEEACLLKIFEKALNQNINCRLLLVPRHPERRNEIKHLLQSQNHSWHLRSENPKAPQKTFIYVGDTIGELAILTQVADLAFIGKSLPPNNGGQTPIEAASLGTPMVYGPMMTNFKQISQSLEKTGASIKCNDPLSLEETILELLKDPSKRHTMSAAAKKWHAANQGATDKTIAAIEKFIHA